MNTCDITFNQYATCGDNYFQTSNMERHPVVFENARLGIREAIVDVDGRIQNFPGVAHPEVVNVYSRRHALERVSFRSAIENLDGAWALVWLVEPEGRYWEGGFGYGALPLYGVKLYARFDERGHFNEPFRLYEVNDSVVYGTDAEMELVSSMADERDTLEYLAGEVSPMVEEVKALLRSRNEFSVSRQLPESCLEATLHVHRFERMWRLAAFVGRRFARLWPREFARRYSPEELVWYLATDEGAGDVLREFQYLLDCNA